MTRPSSNYERPAHLPLNAPSVSLPIRPLISVIMTAHNAILWIDAAIDSILKQSWESVELIVVDDASIDGTRQRIIEIASQDHRLRPVWMAANGGTYIAKNAGLRLARGEVVTFMDSDDISDSSRLEKQLALLRQEGIVATTCNYERRTPEGSIVLNRGLYARQALISLMIRREVIDEVGGFDAVRHGADDEYFERIRSVYGRQAHRNVPESLYLALAREGSLSNTQGDTYQINLDEKEGLPPVRQNYKDSFTAWHASFFNKKTTPYVPTTQVVPIGLQSTQ